MSDVDDDESTLKMLVKLTAETKLLYQDLQSTAKMRRARRLLYLAQMGLMAERSMEAGHAPLQAQIANGDTGGKMLSKSSHARMSDQPTESAPAKPEPVTLGDDAKADLDIPRASLDMGRQPEKATEPQAKPPGLSETETQEIGGSDEHANTGDAKGGRKSLGVSPIHEPPGRRRRNAPGWIAKLS